MSLLLPAEKLTKCEEILGIAFQNKQLCLEALQMNVEPVLWNNQLQIVSKNDRLAILGNNMMRAYFCKQWYDSNQAKSIWSIAEQETLKTANLAKVGIEKGLDVCVLKNNNQIVTPGMLSTTIQALIGAVYVEEGETGMAKLLERLGLKLGYLNTNDNTKTDEKA